jgi:hypothetical protein
MKQIVSQVDDKFCFDRIVNLLVTKAEMEPHFASLYAKVCAHLATITPNILESVALQWSKQRLVWCVRTHD